MKLKPVLAATARGALVLARDVVGLAGMASVAYGAWLISQPAGFIAAGLMLLVVAVLMAGVHK